MIGLLFGCKNIQPTTTMIFQSSPTVAGTFFVPTTTSQPTPAPNTLPGIFQTQCVTVSPKLLRPIQGTLVLSEAGQNNLKSFTLINSEDHDEHLLFPQEGDYFFSGVASPEGNFLASEVYSFSISGDSLIRGTIEVFNAEGKIVSTISFNKSAGSFIWQNEQQILVNAPDRNDYSVLRISPFTTPQKQELIRPYGIDLDFPETPGLEWGFYGYFKNVYDPTGTRMVYPTTNGSGLLLVIRDMEKNIDLATFRSTYLFGNWPTWSPDGQKFAIALNTKPYEWGDDLIYQYEIFVFERDGQNLLSTKLSSNFEETYITKLVWSPNGRYLAFWYTNNPNDIWTHQKLAVLDTRTQVVTDYCIDSGKQDYDYLTSWSPHSDQLAVSYIVAGEDEPSTLVFDIQTGEGTIVKTGFEPVGWLK
jgi:dipeptidyl aminopeptidase/acylaminoacyl peptidase